VDRNSGFSYGASGKTVLKLSAVLAASLVLANCGSSKTGFLASKYGASASPRVVTEGERIPVGGGYSKVGKPYIIAGRVYQPSDPSHYTATGLASWYGDDFHGRLTANGEVFNTFSVSAAHPTLPLPSYIRVTNLNNGRSIIARVNDRGPFHSNRLLDVSERVAEALSFRNAGTTKVKIDYLGKAPQEGSDDARLIATLTTDGTPAVLNGNASASLMTASAEPPRLPLGETVDEIASDITEEVAPVAAPQPVANAPVAVLPPLPKSAVASVPMPPSRVLNRSLATSTALKPVIAAKPVVAPQPVKAPVLSLKAPQPMPTTTFKTAQAQVPVPATRPAQGMFYAPKLVPTSALPVKRLTPQTFVPLNQQQTF
jgi:rare lipoprotein A